MEFLRAVAAGLGTLVLILVGIGVLERGLNEMTPSILVMALVAAVAAYWGSRAFVD